MVYAGVTYGDLYQGNQRFDVNISVAKKGSTELGKRAEIKNLNSFRSIERAVQYEYNRQTELLEKGQPVVQETRGWNDAKQITTSQRSKEDAQDYRYMPDPDIPPVVLTDEYIAEVQATVPMLPPEYRSKLASLGVDSSVITALLNNRNYVALVCQIQDQSDDDHARMVAHWFASSMAKLINGEVVPVIGLFDEPFNVSATDLVLLADKRLKNELSSNAGEAVFFRLVISAHDNTSINIEKYIEENGLGQVSDEGEIAAVVDAVLADLANATSVADVKAGKDKAIGYLVGQVMKQSQGKANPTLAQKLIRERL